jgi:hypothetical protein
MPILQLSALTHLDVRNVGAAAAVAAVDVAMQLTGLRHLYLDDLPDLPPDTLLQLTALTILEELGLNPVNAAIKRDNWLHLQNGVSLIGPSVVGYTLHPYQW